MIKKAGNFDEGALFVTLRVLKNALWGVVLTVAFAASAYALSNNVKTLNYTFHQGPNFSISYEIARDAMKDIYKDYDSNPLIGISESDLNGDGYPEIIAFPTESHEEIGMYCKEHDVCPHYVLQVREKEVKTLAVIFTNSLDTGDIIKNGYWTLRAFSKEGDGVNDYDTYVFNAQKDTFVHATSSTEKPVKPNKIEKKPVEKEDKKTNKKQ